MTDKFPIKLLMFALPVALLLWVVFADGDASDQKATTAQDSQPSSDSIASVIQPIAKASADPSENGVVSGRFYERPKRPEVQLDERSNSDLKTRFEQANQTLSDGKTESAIEQLNSVIKDYPSVVEPYLNLASIYAQRDDLEMARATLMRGIDANQKAGMLFTGLKKVHGAIAASAYRKALDTNADAITVQASLPLVDALVTRFDQSRELRALKSQLENEAKSESLFNETQNKQIAELNDKLLATEKTAASAKSNFEKEIAALNAQLSEQSQSLLATQTAQREAEARVVRAEQDTASQLAQLKAELAEQQQASSEAQAQLKDAQGLLAQQSKMIAQAEQQAQAQALVAQDFDAAKQALNELRDENQALKSQQQALALSAQLAKAEQVKSEQERLAKLDAARKAELAAQQQASADEAQETQALKARQEQDAIARIQSWARAWSAQAVDEYVGHYAENYSSSRSITRAQWLEQRQVRLTNKAFIKVKVSEFEIKDLGPQFSVTFDQHYQSNTVDDIVRKRLIFDKQGDDWAKAKIVSERLVPKLNS